MDELLATLQSRVGDTTGAQLSFDVEILFGRALLGDHPTEMIAVRFDALAAYLEAAAWQAVTLDACGQGHAVTRALLVATWPNMAGWHDRWRVELYDALRHRASAAIRDAQSFHDVAA